MAKIYLKFSTTDSFYSGLIRWRDWSDYSHVDLVLPDGRLLGAHFKGGVHIRESSSVKIFKTFSIEVTPEQHDKIMYLALSQLGKPYDLAGILGFVANRNWEEDDAWFCSELIMWIFKQAGVTLLRTEDVSRISPPDILLSPYLKDV